MLGNFSQQSLEFYPLIAPVVRIFHYRHTCHSRCIIRQRFEAENLLHPGH